MLIMYYQAFIYTRLEGIIVMDLMAYIKSQDTPLNL